MADPVAMVVVRWATCTQVASLGRGWHAQSRSASPSALGDLQSSPQSNGKLRNVKLGAWTLACRRPCAGKPPESGIHFQRLFRSVCEILTISAVPTPGATSCLFPLYCNLPSMKSR